MQLLNSLSCTICLLAAEQPSLYNHHLRTFVIIIIPCFFTSITYSIALGNGSSHFREEMERSSFPFFLHILRSQRVSSPLLIKLTNVKPQQYLSVIFFHHQPHVLMNLLEYVHYCSQEEYNGPV